MKFIKKDKRLLADNDDFIALIKVLREELHIRNKLKPLLALDSFNRKSVLNTWLEELKLQHAPERFIAVLSSLLDDDIAEKVLDIIRE